MNKNPLVAFMLAFIPGVGHAYLGRYIRFIVYAGGFFGPIALLMFFTLVDGYADGDSAVAALLISAFVGLINMIDMVITLLRGKAIGSYRPAPPYPARPGEYGYGGGYQNGPRELNDVPAGSAFHGGPSGNPYDVQRQQEKTRTILLSIIPGLGHMSMGLMQRGITFLISSIGLFAIIIFLSAVMNSGAILTFLLALPVIWVYGMFDAVSLLDARHQGKDVQDKSLFEGIESHIASGTKNKVLTIALAIFPGAGHLYLGLQKRGLQLMAVFLLGIYIMDTLRLSLFLFLLPLFWCFALFDAISQISKYERGALVDEPFLPVFVPYQRWIGAALFLVGVYFLFDRIVMNVIGDYWPFIARQYQMYKYMLPTAIIAFIMILLGMRLAFGSKSILAIGKPPRPEQDSEKRGGASS
ncbi:hypothetical protein ACX93W_25755 [Paenibacillus sp. CAU 1782]